MKILSFGGGVQTVAMALMCIHGDLPMPDCGIFSDPGWETTATYEYLSWFIPYCEENGLTIHVVDNGNIRIDALNTEKRWAPIPLFTIDPEGKKGMLMRQCTNDYKITPVYKKSRELYGLKPYQRTHKAIELWLGISTDECSRMKASRNDYIENKWPLIENNISRAKCISYIEYKGFPVPPKSACIGCPYHSDRFWQEIKDNAPEDFKDACEFDEMVRVNSRKGMKCPMFIHSLRKPLIDIDFTQGQQEMFKNECEGYCGL